MRNAISISRSITNRLRAACAAVALTAMAGMNASAVPVTYTFEMDLSQVNATMDGVAVTGPMTVTATGDTDNIQTTTDNYGNLIAVTRTISNMANTFTLAGFGSFSVASPFTAYSDTWTDNSSGASFNSFGFWTNDGGAFYLSENAYAIESAASAGPLATIARDQSGVNGAFLWDNIATTAGVFTIGNQNGDIPIVFTATVGSANAVPEPASLGLFGIAGLGLLAVRRRKLAQASS